MKYLGKTIRFGTITGKVVAEDSTHIQVMTPSNSIVVIDKINNIITIVSLVIKLTDLLSSLWKKIKSKF